MVKGGKEMATHLSSEFVLKIDISLLKTLVKNNKCYKNVEHCLQNVQIYSQFLTNQLK